MKKKVKKQPKPLKEPAKREPEENDEKDRPFDFGGLPQRDLKKNLGCG